MQPEGIYFPYKIATVRMKELARKNLYSKSVRGTLVRGYPIEGEIRQAVSNGRNNFHAIAAQIRRQILAAWTGRGVQYISNFRREGRGGRGSDRNELICEEDRQQFAWYESREKYQGLCVCVTAEELKTASKINSRPLIQNTYSTCDTFAV